MATYDLVVVGAGLVGLASARALLLRAPQLRLAVLDKEPEVARHQSGRNSGVVHAGIYYAPGSLKARLCVEGARRLLAYAEERGLPVERAGKVIVATSPEELPRLRALHERGLRNGVAGLSLIGPARLRELEPHCAGVAALHSPATAIIDFAAVARAYAADVVAAGGELHLGRELLAVEERKDAITVVTGGGDLTARYLLACAGLHADRVARLSGAPPEPQIVPFRGDYYVLRADRRYLVRGNIYPVPDPSFPFLGVHLSRRTDGTIWLGPSAVLAFAREGYRRRDVDCAELREALGHPGFRRLVRSHWQKGLNELWRSFSRRAFLRALQRYVPELTLRDLLPGPAGVRAQALAPDGALVEDFVVDVTGRALHARNAPSPAATSSLALGDLIAERAAALLGG